MESIPRQATAELVQHSEGSRGRSKVALGRMFRRRLLYIACLSVVPVVMTALLYTFRGSPIMTPPFAVQAVYGSGGINQKFCNALAVADAVVFWAVFEGFFFLAFLIGMPFIGIASALRSARLEYSPCMTAGTLR